MYELLERIGTGGMAEVYRACRRGPAGFERMVALKRIHPEVARDEGVRAMFEEEARVAASFCHKNLVQVFDFGEERGDYYLAMELIDGVDLADLLSRERLLSVSLGLFIARELLSGLAYMHERGVVHRDVNPGNIFVSRAGEVKLGDFGIAKARARAVRTERGTIKGKLGYLAPEQARGEELDGRADTYAVGLVLYEMLAGQRYLAGDSEAALLIAAADPRTRRLKEVMIDVDPKIDALVARLVASAREERFPNSELAAEAVAAVGMAVGGIAESADLAALVSGVSRRKRTGSSMALRTTERKTALATQRRRGWLLPALLGVVATGVAGSWWFAGRNTTHFEENPRVVSTGREPAPPIAPTPLPRVAPSEPIFPPEAPADAKPLEPRRFRSPRATSPPSPKVPELPAAPVLPPAPAPAPALPALTQAELERKLALLDKKLKVAKLSPGDTERATRLIQTALQEALDGRFVDANQRLDELAELLPP